MKAFWRTYLPFLANFLLGRAILQSDLIMIAPFGESASIAFGIPMRIMIIDVVFAFAMAPVVSVQMAALGPGPERTRLGQRNLAIGFWMGLVLGAMGLLIYPFFIKLIAPNSEVERIAQLACLWLTLSIPFRLQQFVASMILHGTGRGSVTSWISLVQIPLNIALNYVCSHTCGLGAQGIYLSTFVASILGLWAHLYFLDGGMTSESFKFPTIQYLKELLSRLAPELGRLISERLSGFVFIGVFSLLAAPSSVMNAYVICFEILFLVSTPLIALMRAVAVNSARAENISKRFALWSQEGLVLIGTLLVSGFLAIYRVPIFAKLYSTPVLSNWYLYFISTLPVLIVLRWLGSLIRGRLQAMKRLDRLFWADLLAEWGVLLPIAMCGIYWSRPAVFWLAFVISDLAAVSILLFSPPQRPQGLYK